MDEFEINVEERYSERAAIMRHCGGLPKEKAEALARAEAESWRKARETAARDAEVNR